MPEEEQEIQETEEQKQEEKPQEEVQEEEKQELSPIEQLAVKIGWNPNHESNDERNYLSAEDFILKSKEIQNTSSKQIKNLNRQITELQNGLKGLEQHNKAVYKAHITQLKREMAELKLRRKEASADGDHDLVQQYDDQINEIRKVPEELPETSHDLHPAFVEWADENDWYGTDNELRAYADMLGTQPEYRALAEKDYKTMLNHVTQSVKKMFPHKFNPKQPEQIVTMQRTPTVEKSTNRAKPKTTKFSYGDLTRQQQDLCDFYVKQGIMTKEEYIEDLRKIAENS